MLLFPSKYRLVLYAYFKKSHHRVVLPRNAGAVTIDTSNAKSTDWEEKRGGYGERGNKAWWRRETEWEVWTGATARGWRTGGKSWGKRQERERRGDTSEGWGGQEGEGRQRHTVFLGETIITMSNGSSHRPLPEPSTVISRAFFQLPPHVRGWGRPAPVCWTRALGFFLSLRPHSQSSFAGWLLHYRRKGRCRWLGARSISRPPLFNPPHPPYSVLFTPLLLYIFYAERNTEKQPWIRKRKRKAPLFASLINLPNDFPYCESEPPKDDSRSPPALVWSVKAAWLKRRGPGHWL